MSEIEKLLSELRNMKSENTKKNIANNKDTWSKIGNADWTGAGFDDENETKEWIESNLYANI
jgi:hypothetical protein